MIEEFMKDNLGNMDTEHILPRHCGILQDHYNLLVKENLNLKDAMKNPLTSYTIKSGPIVLEDPVFDDNPAPKFSYLKRGSGLARFNMTIDELKKGPPDLYKKKEFKSFLTDKPNRPKQKVAKQTVKTFKCTEPETKKFVKVGPTKVFSERKFTLQPVKSFDDEVIPTLKKYDMHKAFEVPVPNKFISQKPDCQINDIPKTPMKSLKLTNANQFQQEKEDEIIRQLNSSIQEINSDQELPSISPTARKLTYNEPEESAASSLGYKTRETPSSVVSSLPWDKIASKAASRFEKLQRKSCQQLMSANLETNNCVNINLDSETDEVPRRSSRDIAEAMRRKGLTDNVKKQLGWNVSPRKKKPIRIVKKIKIKKARPVVKEKLTYYELKDRMLQLEQVKEKLLLDYTKVKRTEKDFFDKKMQLDKDRKEMEKRIEREREELLEERNKLAEDQKKLKREKVAFEKYCQDTKNLAPREDRDEIRKLKAELESLKTAQRTKDARYGALQAQLRNRVILLEKENAELRRELEESNKVTTKRVRFDSGKVTGKVIDAINKQLETKLRPQMASAREKPLAKIEQLRRSKSSNDLKPAVVHTRPRGKTVDSSSTVLRKEPAKSIVPEVIDLLGDDEYVNKGKDFDSGIDTRTSSEESSSRSFPVDKPVFQSSTYSALQEMRRRVGNLLGHLDEPAAPSYDSAGARPAELNSDRQYSSRTSSQLSEVPGDSNRQGNSTVDVQGNHAMDSANIRPGFPPCCDKSRTVLDVSDVGPTNATTPTSSSRRVASGCNEQRSGSSVCARHGLPLVESNKIRETRYKVPVDRDVIRTEVGGGDVEEEELHTGVRRLWCGSCGACETTYRNRPGYRRTTSPDGSTMEEHQDGMRECRYKTGEITKKYPNGDKLLLLPNGDKEFTTRGYKKLERPDGIIRTLYDDGRLETRYPSGRIRIKNAEGHLIMDTGGLLR